MRISGLSHYDQFQLNVFLQHLENINRKCRWEARNWISKVKVSSGVACFKKHEWQFPIFCLSFGWILCWATTFVCSTDISGDTSSCGSWYSDNPIQRSIEERTECVIAWLIKFKYVKLQADWLLKCEQPICVLNLFWHFGETQCRLVRWVLWWRQNGKL